MTSRRKQPRIVLVKPPEESNFNFGTFSLAVLAAAVRDIAKVTIIDATAMAHDDAAEAVWAPAPDIVGITTMGFTSVCPVSAFLDALRRHARRRPSTKIVVGGHGASMLPSRLLAAGADAVVIGEGEWPFRQIVMYGIRAGTPGVACRDGNEVVLGPAAPLQDPLDALPLPARDLMPQGDGAIHLMETSRGCPHACAFCETVRFHGRRWRHHSPERVAREVADLIASHQAWIIQIADDNFSASRRRMVRICDELSRGDLPACFMVSARADDLLSGDDILPALAAARFLRISVGIETLDGDLAHVTGKTLSIAEYRNLFQRMRQLGIFSVASFIVGLPGERPKMRQRAVELALSVAPDAARFLPFYPLPGTPLAQGHAGIDPDPNDVAYADACNRAFLENAVTRERLMAAIADGGIRGALAMGTLDRSRVLDLSA